MCTVQVDTRRLWSKMDAISRAASTTVTSDQLLNLFGAPDLNRRAIVRAQLPAQPLSAAKRARRDNSMEVFL